MSVGCRKTMNQSVVRKNRKSLKIGGLLSFFSVCFLLASCGNFSSGETSLTVKEMAAAVLESQEELPSLYAIGAEEEDFRSFTYLYLQNLSDSVLDGVICYPSVGVEASEVAVFLLPDEAAALEAGELLQGYLENRISAFAGYAPEQAAIAENGKVEVMGRYAALLICPDSAKAQEVFRRCFSQTPPTVNWQDSLLSAPAGDPEKPTGESPSETDPSTQEPPAEDDYCHDTVLEAWRTGKTTALAGKNLAVYEACQAAIGEVITDDMSADEKESAIHDWMIKWGDYDPAALNGHTGETPDPDHDNPYGFLVGRKGICLGYASTFQLFMDMLDIPCITVLGHSWNGEREHAWNMVQLDEDWYCVDVTWDDPVSEKPVAASTAHLYYNVTSAYMRDTDHQWDESATPEAEGTAYRWLG